jgi:hypothetical protein
MPTPGIDSPPRPPLLQRIGAALRRLLDRRRRLEPIRDAAALRRFLHTRTSYVAQSTLYGYLRTRAGVRFPELFDDDRFVVSTNIAKWHVWLACVSDLSVYAGGLVRRNSGAADAEVGPLMRRVVDEILAETGTPGEAGPEFDGHAGRVRARIALCDWGAQADGDAPFVESPAALVHWAPIVEDLKALDEEIVRNSVRFRWNEIRRQLRQALDATAVVAATHASERAGTQERTAPRA